MTPISENSMKKLLSLQGMPDISFLDEYFLDDEEIIQIFDSCNFRIYFLTNKRIIILDIREELAMVNERAFKFLNYSSIISYSVKIPASPRGQLLLEISFPDDLDMYFGFDNRDKAVRITKAITESCKL